MKREEDGRKHRTGESADRRPRDPEREARREREKHRDRDSMKEGDRTRHRDPEKTRDDDRRRDEGHRRRDGTRDKEDRDKERRRERDKDRGIENDRYKDRERESWERRKDRAEKENRDRERERERERERNKERDGDKERERRRPEPERERRSEKDRKREEEREGRSDRDKDRLQEREKGRDKERERERRERHKDRESKQYRDEQQEKHRERERREKEYSGHRDQREHREHRREKEERERKKKEREQRERVETQGPDNSSRETERERRHRERKESDGHLAGNRDGEKEREKEKREKRHERSHRVESDTRRDDRERKQKSTSDRERSDKTSREKEVENEDAEIDKPTAEDYGNEEYEDDFEDYEEDFEEIDEDEDGPQEEEEERREEEEGEDSRGEIQKKEELNPRRREEIEAIQRAMDEENERVSSTPSRPMSEMPKRDAENRSKRSSTHGRIINFVAAKQREVSKKAASKQKKRTTELLRLIDLDFSITFPLLDLPPVNEYDMYIKNFGATNTRQAYVQCPDDNIDREIQTEEVDVTDKWTQHPAEGSIVCGGPKLSNESSVESVVQMNSMDSRRLTSFLRSAAQVVAVLLEEDRAERHSLQKLRSQTDALSFSDGCLQLNTRLPFLHGREVSLLQFSQVQRQTLLSVHAPCTKASAVRLDSNTIICIWNMWEPSRPQKILLYDGEVRCCCFSPGKARLVFAGTAVGSVVIWDLREHSREHYNLRIGEEDWTLRYPTFSTDAVLAGAGHLSTVRSVEPIVATVEEGLRPERPLMASQDESLELSFQLASLDEYGVLNLWVVVELPKADGAGSQTDLGLRPGGKVKLLHSSSINTCDKSTSRDVVTLGPSLSLQLKFLPKDSNHYYISTNTGLVRHGTLHGLKTAPKLYRSQVEGLSPVEVTALDFSPSGEPFFLAGCSDGSVRLYSVKIESPVQEWTGSSSGGAAVVSVQWSVTRPSVFCVLDGASDLHVWDLNERDDAPLITENIHNDRVTAVAMFGEPARQKVYAGLALAKHSGRIEIQYFNKKFTVPVTAESQKLHSLLHDAF